MAVFVGPRFAEFYAAKFAAFEQGSSASWNWPAFFGTSFWLLYRKMWAYTLSYWFLLPLLLALTASVAAFSGSGASNGLWLFNIIYYGGYLIAAFVVIPIFANRLYYRVAKKRIKKITERIPAGDEQRLEIARKGGTSNIAIVILPFFLISLIGVLAAIAIPAYQDYTIRAQVSEGLRLASSARAAVVAYAEEEGRLPASNREAGLPAPGDLSGNYVESVRLQGDTIVITYGQSANSILSGKTLNLQVVIMPGANQWRCFSDEIEKRHLPAACR